MSDEMEQGTSGAETVWTVGHSNHALEDFLALLEANGIEILADVRTQPFSRFSPQFNADTLKLAVAERGIRYAFFGDTLGGRPRDEEYYDRDGHVRYDRVAGSDFFGDGVQKLRRGVARGYRIALMCSEEDPAVCHRHLLVARVLREQGVTVLNIRGDSSVADYQEVENPGGATEDVQTSLFGPEEVSEEKPWRSLLSVLPKRPRSDFSGD